MNLVMNMMMTNDWSPQQKGFKGLKSDARSNERKIDVEGGKLLDLLKNTQSSVKALENEFKKVESENLHQDWRSKI